MIPFGRRKSAFLWLAKHVVQYPGSITDNPAANDLMMTSRGDIVFAGVLL